MRSSRSSDRFRKSGFVAWLIFTCLSAPWMYSICSRPKPEFEHDLQRQFVIHQLSRNNTSQTSKHCSQGSISYLTDIYEKQLTRFRAAPFLPTFHNDHLQIRLNQTAIIHHLSLHSKWKTNVTRDLSIQSITSHGEHFNFTIHFMNQVSLIHKIFWTVKQCNSSWMFISSFTAETMKLDIQQRFSRPTIFRFTYQWSDTTDSHPLSWPIWPLHKSCLEQVSSEDLSCLMTDVLRHSSSRELFLAEQSATQHWLDIQYTAASIDPSRAKEKQPRRLVPFEIAMNRNICSPAFTSSIQQYQAWHEQIIHNMTDHGKYEDFILDHDLRFLLYQTLGSGTADRIVHLITTYFIAILTKRVFLFDPKWPEFSDIMQSTLNDNPPQILSWFSSHFTRRPFGTFKNLKRMTFRTYRFGLERLTKDFDYEKTFSQRVVIVRGHTGGLRQMVVSNSSIYRQRLNEELHLTVESIFGCLFHSLLIHRLSALIERTSQSAEQSFIGYSPRQLLQILLSPEYFPIGIQVRTDDSFVREKKHSQSKSDELVLKDFANYIVCAQQWAQQHGQMLIKSRQIPIALLISDTVRLRQAVLRRWQYPSSCFHSSNPTGPNQTLELHFVASPDQILHVAYTDQRGLALNLAMFDIFLFSLCEQHLITRDSGFGRIGVFAALKGRSIFSLAPKQYLNCAKANETISLLRSSHDWSGV